MERGIRVGDEGCLLGSLEGLSGLPTPRRAPAPTLPPSHPQLTRAVSEIKTLREEADEAQWRYSTARQEEARMRVRRVG